ncbi:hypothetical protein E3N88_23500 [Mikania micrantha]|uniref:Uncharacterized protein n=1 Tax=Mikania micrantha TaxID=192012 RepID=A0A5N6NEK6_9ASTR|nr:hypothetical protein E3N88_23500 [Mikania micrantha]
MKTSESPIAPQPPIRHDDTPPRDHDCSTLILLPDPSTAPAASPIAAADCCGVLRLQKVHSIEKCGHSLHQVETKCERSSLLHPSDSEQRLIHRKSSSSVEEIQSWCGNF